MSNSKNGFFIVNRFHNLNLRTKFILTFLAVALVPLGLLAFLNDRATRARLTEDANQALFTAASQTAANLEAFINANLDVIRTEAELPLWAKYLKLPPDQRASSDLEPEVRATVRALSRKTNISSYALLDIEGRTVMDTFASNIGLVKSDRDYFQQPLKTGLPYVSPVEFSQTTGNPSLYFSSPVRNSARNIVGVLRIRYDADVLQDIVAQSNNLAGPDSFAVLFDEHHIRLAHGLAPETIFQTVTPLDPTQIATLQAARRLPDLPPEELSTDLAEFEGNLTNAAAQPFFTASDVTTQDKLNHVAVVTMKTQPWLVAFFQPQEVFLAPVQAQTDNALLLAGLMAVVVVAVAVGMGQLLSRPIVRLTAVAQQVAAGNLNTQAAVESRDEIGQLAATFNGMTVRLKQTIDSLNQRIVEQQRTQEALRASEATNRALLEAIPDAIFQFDPRGTFVTFIPAQAFKTILAPDEFLGKSIEDVLPPDLARQTRHSLEQVLQTGKGQTFEYSLPIDGETRYFEARQVTVGDDRVLSIVRDVTERVQAEESLRESQTLYHSLVENLPQSIFRKDLDGRFTFANQRFCTTRGRSLSDVLGKTDFDLHPLRLAKKYRQDDRQVVETRQIFETVEEHQAIDGESLYVQVIKSPLYDSRGQVAGIQGIFWDITESKRAEEALRRAEEKYRNIVENAIEGFFQSTPDGRFLTANPAMARMFGYASPEEMIQSVTDIGGQLYVDPSQRIDVKQRLEAEGSVQGFEMLLRRKDGAVFWASENVRTVQDKQGRILYYEGMLADITARKQAEQALRLSEERYRNFVEQSTEGIWMLAFDEPIPLDLPAEEQARRIQAQGYVAECNDALARMYGYASSQELIGVPLLQLYGGPSEVNFRATWELVQAGYRAGNRETQEVTASGETVYFLNSAVGMIQPGQLVAIWGTQQDITLLKRAEQALRESEQKFRSLVEQAYDAIVLSDHQGVVIEWNQAAEQLSGYPRAEMLGRPMWEVQLKLMPAEKRSPAVQEWLVATVSQGLQTGGAPWFNQSLEAELQRADGTLCHFQQVAFPIQSAKGFMIGTFVRDITERKLAEEELRRYRERLEELVQERTRELEEAQAELLRRERLSALGQLTATVAHEIRNPLGTVRTAVFAIGDAIERDETYRVERARQLAERNILRCDRIITELLDYTRERALNLKPTPIDPWLDALLDEMWQGVPPAISENVVCTRDLNTGCQVLVDSEHLRRAVINVVNNAVDALLDETSGGNQLTVSTRIVGERAAARLEIRVSDTGCGIPADMMDKVFEPLFSTKTFGVGLGLPIVKSIMQQHGGDVEIESRAAEGTTVTLWLPVSNAGGDQGEAIARVYR